MIFIKSKVFAHELMQDLIGFIYICQPDFIKLREI